MIVSEGGWGGSDTLGGIGLAFLGDLFLEGVEAGSMRVGGRIGFAGGIGMVS